MDSYINRNRGYITCSKWKCYKQSKEAFKKIFIDEVNTDFLPDSKAFENWKMVDQFILTPEEFEKNYAILYWTLKKDLIQQCETRGIIVEKSDKVDDLKKKLVGDKKVLTGSEEKMLFWIKRELKRQPLFDFDGEYEAQKEIIVEYKWHKLKWTIDRLWKTIRDLKTTRDLEYKNRTECTKFEDNLNNFDEYEYWAQLARYAVLVYIQTWERKDWIIDAVKTSWNFAYEAYFYHRDTLKAIAMQKIFPVLDMMIENINRGDFSGDILERAELINNRYYPILDSAIQKEFRVIEPSF